MTLVKACKNCQISVEANAIIEKTNIKESLPIEKCPLCGSVLVEDDSENYY